MQMVRQNSPRDFVLSYERIEQFGKRHYPVAREEYQPVHTVFRHVDILDDWLTKNLDPTLERPMSLLLVSPSRYGKTEWARSHGAHFYMCGLFNLEDYDPTATYGVFDDFCVDHIKYSYKQWFGCQKQFTLTDKYKKKITVKWGKPSIFLLNPPVYEKLKEELDWDWVQSNTVICILTNKLY